MLIQSVRFTFAPQDAQAADAMLRELRDASRKEGGVIAFEVARGKEQPNNFSLWEEYQDEAALNAHKATDHYERLVINGVRPLAKERTGELLLPI